MMLGLDAPPLPEGDTVPDVMRPVGEPAQESGYQKAADVAASRSA